ncbi:MAG: aspartate aminotransferase family protein [Pseudomonadota bacterium]
MSDFDLEALVETFTASRSLTDTYAEVLNNQAVKYTNALGYEGVEFVDCAPHHLIARDGTRYLDFIAGFAIHHWGRRHPVITKALRQAAEAPWPNLLQLGVPTLSTILAERLTDVAGDGFDRVFFTNCGAETSDYAIKMAVVATGRKRMLYLTGDYHGLTLTAISVNGVTKQQKLFHVDGENLQVPFNDIETLKRAFAEHGREIAGLIIEPVQARHGLVATDAYLTEARALCEKHGAMLIFDEIKSGFGRTGRNFFFEWTPVRPDILMLAKGLSAGAVPVGALLYPERLHRKVFKDVERLAVFSSTFRENNFSMAAGLAVLHLMEHENPLANVLAAEARIRDRLDGQMLPSGEVVEVVGKGLQLSIRVAGRGKSLLRSAIDAVEKDLFYTLCCERLMKEHRIVTMIPNRFGEALAVIPALNIPLALVDAYCDGVLETFTHFSEKSSVAFLGSVAQSARKLI